MLVTKRYNVNIKQKLRITQRYNKNNIIIFIISKFTKKNEVMEIKLRFLQLNPDLFADARIRKLKGASNGYIMLIIYLRLLTLALPDNGYIIYDAHFISMTEQLCYALNDENESDIEATIAYCVALGLIEIIGEKEQLYLTQFGAMTNNYKNEVSTKIITKTKSEKKPSLAAIRQRRYRENKKLKEKLLQEALKNAN